MKPLFKVRVRLNQVSPVARLLHFDKIMEEANRASLATLDLQIREPLDEKVLPRFSQNKVYMLVLKECKQPPAPVKEAMKRLDKKITKKEKSHGKKKIVRIIKAGK
jgi:hypothetical protein